MKTFTAAQLKWIALLSMAVDHVACIFLSSKQDITIYMVMRIAGRISFPVFAYLLFVGLCNTHNRKKYLIRMLLFAIISEVPYDLALHHKIIYGKSQNIFFTLSIGLGMMIILERKKEWWGRAKQLLFKIGIVVLAAGLAWAVNAEYSFLGIALIAIFYFTQNTSIWQIGLSAVVFLLSGTTQYFAVFSLPLIWKYNGQKGDLIFPGWFFYVFYPAHLLLLAGIRYFAG